MTGHLIKNKPSKYPELILSDHPRIAGTKEMLDQFSQINHSSESYIPSSIKIEDIPDDQLNTMSSFTLKGLNVKARVLNVIDGDTIDGAFFIPGSYLCSTQTIKYRWKPKTIRPALGFPDDRGFFIRINIRANGIDTAEKDTHKGQIAKSILQKIVERLDRYIYLHILKYEKYGRVLADIYEDPDHTILVNKTLLDYDHPVLGKVCVPYCGKKKIPWPTTPPHYMSESV